MSAREIVALLFRELKLVLVALLVPVVAAVLLFLTAAKSYEADAKILVSGRDSQARNVADPSVAPPSPRAPPKRRSTPRSKS